MNFDTFFVPFAIELKYYKFVYKDVLFIPCKPWSFDLYNYDWEKINSIIKDGL